MNSNEFKKVLKWISKMQTQGKRSDEISKCKELSKYFTMSSENVCQHLQLKQAMQSLVKPLIRYRP